MAWPTLPTNQPVDWRAAALLTVRRYCGWHVAPVITETITLDGSGSSALLLPSNQALAIESLTEDGEEVDVSTLSLSVSGVVRKERDAFWTRKLGGIVVELRHGYDEYADLEGVVSQVAARSAATGAGAVSESAGPFNIRRATVSGGAVAGAPLLETEKEALAPYRLTWGV